MLRLAPLAAVLLACAALATATGGSAAGKPRVTMFGDSVAAALAYQAKARAHLGKGLDLRLDARVCRRLVEAGCPYNGNRPESVLALVKAPTTVLGDVVVVDVGYNDVPSAYGDDVDHVMRALTQRGVTIVIWVTMQETRSHYRATNAAIGAAARRWPQLRIAEWHEVSRARTNWFADDGLHLTSTGAMGLARFLRPLVLAESCTGTCLRRIVRTES